jgi:hypothetical protein
MTQDWPRRLQRRERQRQHTLKRGGIDGHRCGDMPGKAVAHSDHAAA